ncbi:MAG: PepSY domain-containing protein [Candidatus Margulisbacteria bacterium]|nr:PepSY domain-containing protein [Candidatus Margulisiibacteriota bacterium]
MAQYVKSIHRFLGISASIFIVTLAVTGLLLNHPQILESKDPTNTIKGQIKTIAVHPSHSNEVWFGTNQGLYVSKDKGKSSQYVDLKLGHYPIQDLDFIGADVIVAIKDGYILRSHNSGNVWERVPLPDGVTEILSIDAQISGLTIVSTSGVYHTSLQAWDWQRMMGQGTGGNIKETIKAIHTGYIFFPLLTYLYDGAAVILVIMVVTGFVMYIRTRNTYSNKY